MSSTHTTGHTTGHTAEDEALLKAGVEPDHPPVFALVIEIVVMMVILVLTFASLYGVTKLVTHRENGLKAGSAVNIHVAEVRAREAAVLSGYDQLDAGKGIYRIPVGKAMEKLAANPELIKAIVPAAAPAPAPAAVPAPVDPAAPAEPTAPAAPEGGKP